MRSASTMASTIRAAPCTAPCSTAEILAEVYLELIGGRQVAFALAAEIRNSQVELGSGIRLPARQRPEPLPLRLTAEQRSAHQALLRHSG